MIFFVAEEGRLLVVACHPGVTCQKRKPDPKFDQILFLFAKLLAIFLPHNACVLEERAFRFVSASLIAAMALFQYIQQFTKGLNAFDGNLLAILLRKNALSKFPTKNAVTLNLEPSLEKVFLYFRVISICAVVIFPTARFCCLIDEESKSFCY